MERAPRGPPATTLWALFVAAGLLIQFSYGTSRWKRETCRRNQFQCNSGACLEGYLLCDGLQQCDDGSDEVADICRMRTCPSLAFQCEYGACIDKMGLCNGTKECSDGSDEKPERCGKPLGASPPRPNGSQSANEVLCPALIHPSREIICKLDQEEKDCSKSMSAGTIAVVRCRIFYTTKREFSQYSSVCKPDGKWSKEMTPCTPKCGETNPIGLPFVAGGTKAKYGEFTWHAGVYRLFNGSYRQVCGGSIISERAVITSAHCLRNYDRGSQIDVKYFKIAVGKLYRDWDGENERYKQLPEIEKIVLHDRFRGEALHYAYNIALVKLSDPIQISAAVQPICLDYDKKYERMFVPGKKGIVMGWGITEKQVKSETIHHATLPYVSFEDCFESVPTSFQPFLTRNTFCAGYRNGTAVCPGDSGGGYAVQFTDGRYYLMGIVSVGVVPDNAKDACNINHYSVFTKVPEYYDFILQHTAL